MTGPAASRSSSPGDFRGVFRVRFFIGFGTGMTGTIHHKPGPRDSAERAEKATERHASRDRIRMRYAAAHAASAPGPPALRAQPERDRFRQAPRWPARAAAGDAQASRAPPRASL